MTQLLNPQLTVHDQRVIAQIAADWRLTPATYAYKISRGTWIPSKHLQFIAAKVAKAIAKGNGRIIISAPPRHGKSQLTSIYTPGWLLERYPHYKTILAGYGAELATGFSRQVRDMIMDPNNEHLLKTRIRKDASRVEAFLTPEGGGMYAVGLGGAITGRGANVLLIDDYIKEIKEALSPAYRDYIWNWFVTTAYTRLEPGGTCIIIATRWHSDDLIGRILATQRDQWEYIELPAIAEENDQIGRAVGEPLFPERYPVERLEELRGTLGSIFFAALFQQKPVDETGKISDRAWLKPYPYAQIPEHELRDWKFARIWDLAATPDDGDYTVGTKLAHNKKLNKTIIMNVIRDQMSPAQIESKVRLTAVADTTDVDVYIEQEPGSSGIHLVDHYARNVLPEFHVEGIPAVVKKLIRAQPMLAAAEAGDIWYMEGSWNEPFLREFDTFPTGEFDDQVDTAAAGFQRLSGKRIFTAAWGRKTGRARNSEQIRKAQFALANGGKPARRITGATFGRKRS